MSPLPAVPDLATRVAALEGRVAELEGAHEAHDAQDVHVQLQIRVLAQRIGITEKSELEALEKRAEVKP